MTYYLNGYTDVQEDKKRVKIINPSTMEVIGELSHPESGDGERILEIAQKGFGIWSGVSLAERADILMRYADILSENAEHVAKVECRDMGKVIRECRGEVATAIALTKGYVEKAKHLQGRVVSENQKGLEKDIIFTKHEPYGVVLCIVPFNYPVELFTHKVVAALVMGNAVIVKCPSDNPLSLLEITRMMVEAGVPKEAVQLVYASHEFVQKELIASPVIQAISLTGSTKAGIDIWRNSADTMHRLYFELGGNDPLLILKDANLEYAVNEMANSRLGNTGQICCASKRFIVHRSLVEELVERLKDRLEKVVRGNPQDDECELGCIISSSAAEVIMGQIQKTIDQGAQCVYGNVLRDKTFVEPTILTNVSKDMDIAKDMEVFGPVFPIIAFDTEEEALEIANQSCYGLEAAIITKDLEKAIYMASKIQAGSVVVNGAGSYRHMDMPFGGYKMSGVGRESISTTLEEFSQEKNYVIKNVINFEKDLN